MQALTKILKSNRSGFTLIELVITIALLVISVGVTSDIILTLVKSYTKNQIATEVEQSANFVLLKLEKELRGGGSVTPVGGANSITFTDAANVSHTYSLNGTVMQRDGADLTQSTGVGAVQVSCTGSCFTVTNVSGVQSVQLNITFAQPTLAGQSSITYTIRNTIVPRGNY